MCLLSPSLLLAAAAAGAVVASAAMLKTRLYEVNMGLFGVILNGFEGDKSILLARLNLW